MRKVALRTAAAAAAAAILFNSSVALAAAPSPASSAGSQTSWMALSMMTPSAAVGLAGTAAQPADVPPPPPPPQAFDNPGNLVVAGIFLADIALMLYIALSGHNNRHLRGPNSPG